MSDSDESFELHRDMKPYSFEPFAKKIKSNNGTESVNVAGLDIDTEAEQPPVPPTPAPGPQSTIQ
jgi:hypothetical protein